MNSFRLTSTEHSARHLVIGRADSLSAVHVVGKKPPRRILRLHGHTEFPCLPVLIVA
jgi:hypothetical protein